MNYRSVGVCFFALAIACADEPPALTVGRLAFSADELAAVPASVVPSLADIAGWGLAVRDETQAALTAPIVDRAADRSRLRTLPYALAARGLGLGEEELRAAYEASPEWELRVRHIVRLADEDAPTAERLRALDEAQEVLRRARAGEDFAALAAERSEEPGAAQSGGLLQPGRQGTWVDPFWNAALGLEVGELSDVVETEYGFHVLRLEGRQPVPWPEADRAALLRRVVPPADALAAMEAWAPGAPAPELGDATLREAHSLLRAGEFALDALLASGEGWTYTGQDLAAAWAGTSAGERQVLVGASDAPLRSWLENDLREEVWSAEAARLGAPIQPEAVLEARREWAARSDRWGATFGFAPAATEESLREAALRGVAASGQEHRIARQDLEAMRPLLRAAYPVARPADSGD